MNEEFDNIRKSGRLLIEYIRGSKLYGLDTPQSDTDTGGVFIANMDNTFGNLGYRPHVKDERGDNVWYEVGTFVDHLMSSTPSAFEALYAPSDKIIGEVAPEFEILREHRDEFISKECFWPYFGFAKSQIVKARGLNKKITNPIEKRKTPLEFTYTFMNQGSILVEDWLTLNGLKKEFCGLNNVPHMEFIYGLYYDWGAHYESCKTPHEKEHLLRSAKIFSPGTPKELLKDWLEDKKPLRYRGLEGEEIPNATQLRLSSVEKDARPLCWISFNQSAFQKHCREYREYQEWVKERNPVRYESNLNKTYDSKNLLHAFRAIHMGREIADGKGINLVRTDDHDFLMNVRDHKYEYDELIEILEKESKEMEEAIKKSTIPDSLDREKLDGLLIELRRKFYGI